MCKWCVLWHWYLHMFCVLTVVRVYVLCSDSGTCICFVFWHWYVYMFCVLTVVCAYVLCSDVGTCICFVFWQWYVYMFFVLTVVRVYVLCFDNGTCICFLFWHCYAKKMFDSFRNLWLISFKRIRIFDCSLHIAGCWVPRRQLTVVYRLSVFPFMQISVTTWPEWCR